MAGCHNGRVKKQTNSHMRRTTYLVSMTNAREAMVKECKRTKAVAAEILQCCASDMMSTNMSQTTPILSFHDFGLPMQCSSAAVQHSTDICRLLSDASAVTGTTVSNYAPPGST